MNTIDIWADTPYGNYVYPTDSLLHGTDSLQQAETMRMLHDMYFSSVGTSQGANQFISFCNRVSDRWLPSLFSDDNLLLKVVLLVLIAVFSSIYSVGEQENGVVVMFGKVVRTDTAGLHFKLPFLQQVRIVDMTTHGFGIGYDAMRQAKSNRYFNGEIDYIRFYGL